VDPDSVGVSDGSEGWDPEVSVDGPSSSVVPESGASGSGFGGDEDGAVDVGGHGVAGAGSVGVPVGFPEGVPVAVVRHGAGEEGEVGGEVGVVGDVGAVGVITLSDGATRFAGGLVGLSLWPVSPR
jgi:hypothetical protein